MTKEENLFFIEENINSEPFLFYKGEFIPIFQSNKQEIAFIKSGIVSLMKSDIHGNLIYIDSFRQGDILSKIWIYNEDHDLFLVCSTKVEIYFLDYSMITMNSNPRFLQDFLQKILFSMNYLYQKVSILQKKNMEDKLMCYFRIESKKCGSKKFEVPITFKELADYLGVDRSSLMRKLSELEQKKKIKKKGKTIFLKD